MESPPSLEEEAAMTEPFAGREPYYDGEYDEPPSWYPADDVWDYPGSDDFPAFDNDDGDYVPYGPADPNFNGYDPGDERRARHARESQPMKESELGRYVCTAPGGCRHSPEVTVCRDGVWIRYPDTANPGSFLYGSAHRDCFENGAKK